MKTHINVIFPIIILHQLFAACSSPNAKSELDPIQQKFTIPEIIGSPVCDTIALFSLDFLNVAVMPFCGKYQFTQTLRLNDFPKRNDTFKRDYIREYVRAEPNDSINTEGFKVIADYTTTIIDKYRFDEGNAFFPIYVVNETTQPKMFVAKDSHVFGIQEALINSNEFEWRPFECRGLDFCGNGYFGLKIYPGEFVVFLAPKYDGDATLDMRVRLQIGETIYFSNSYRGKMSPKQFLVKEGFGVEKLLKYNRPNAIETHFLGAIPVGYDNI